MRRLCIFCVMIFSGCWVLCHSTRKQVRRVGESLSVECKCKKECKKDQVLWCSDTKTDQSWCDNKFNPKCCHILKGRQSCIPKETKKGELDMRCSGKEFNFTVTMKNLTEKDSGTYYCSRTKDPRFNITELIVVAVSQKRTTTSVLLTTILSHASSSISSTTVTTTPIDSTAIATTGSSDTEPLLAFLIPAVILLLVTLVVLVTLFFMRRKKKKQQAINEKLLTKDKKNVISNLPPKKTVITTVYAVAGNDGRGNPNEQAVKPEHVYEEIHDPTLGEDDTRRGDAMYVSIGFSTPQQQRIHIYEGLPDGDGHYSLVQPSLV